MSVEPAADRGLVIVYRARVGDDICYLRLAEQPGQDLAGGVGRLAHGDLDVTRIFTAAGRYSGIIDFGETRGADRFFDLGQLSLRLGPQRRRSPASPLARLRVAELANLLEGKPAALPR